MMGWVGALVSIVYVMFNEEFIDNNYRPGRKPWFHTYMWGLMKDLTQWWTQEYSRVGSLYEY